MSTKAIDSSISNIIDILNISKPALENANDIALIKNFLQLVNIKYYEDFVVRCVFDRVYRAGLYSSEFPPIYNAKLNASQEKNICDLFYRLANKLAIDYCSVYNTKKRSYEMLSIMLFNHYIPFESKAFAEVGSHTRHLAY